MPPSVLQGSCGASCYLRSCSCCGNGGPHAAPPRTFFFSSVGASACASAGTSGSDRPGTAGMSSAVSELLGGSASMAARLPLMAALSSSGAGPSASAAAAPLPHALPALMPSPPLPGAEQRTS